MAQTRQNMGSGNVKKLLLQLMIPAVVAQVVNLLYNIVDRIYIGHIAGIGAAALTGVGLFAPILMLLNAFAMLIGAGGAPRTAIALGHGNKEEAEKPPCPMRWPTAASISWARSVSSSSWA